MRPPRRRRLTVTGKPDSRREAGSGAARPRADASPARSRAGLGSGSAPRQLPPGAAGFAGRAAPLTLLSELADEAVTDPGAVVICAISGMAGVGKTALALHWAHLNAAKFPGGQLYADLRGFNRSGGSGSCARLRRLSAGFLERARCPLHPHPAQH